MLNDSETPPGPGSARTPPVDGREHALDPNAVAAARVAAGIGAAVIALGTLLALLVSLAASYPGPLVALLLLAAWSACATGLGVMSYFWPAVRYRHISYRLDERGLRIRRGVFWRSEISVPKSRVQHTDVSAGPVERSFTLATLIVHTAGTEHAAVSLGGLAFDDAHRIRDYLIEGGQDDAV